MSAVHALGEKYVNNENITNSSAIIIILGYCAMRCDVLASDLIVAMRLLPIQSASIVLP